MQPGRSCPLHYRYAPAVLNRKPELSAETLYVIGGLYGNLPALDAVRELVANEPGGATLVFNGDFNWFNIDPAGFSAINEEVLKHTPLRGNVETELAGADDGAGCGCGYPEWVGNAEVERSNHIAACLRATARQFPALREQLAALPMHLVAEVGGVRVAIVHGDAHSLAGWDYSRERLADPAHRRNMRNDFSATGARVIASSHTCLPVLAEFDTADGHALLINNGAAGMPNFARTRHGVITRISIRPAAGADVLYGSRIDHIHIDALPLHYNHPSWLARFSANWPAGSPAHTSYFHRIVNGPGASQQADAHLMMHADYPEHT